jgi:hypothetical protein
MIPAFRARTLHTPATLAASLAVLAGVWQAFAGAVQLELRPAMAGDFQSSAGGEVCQPEPGGIVIVGQIDSPDFSAASPSQLTLETVTGERLPLVLDARSFVSQFGRLVACRFASRVPPGLAGAATNGLFLVLRWGEGITVSNRVVAGFSLDATAAGTCWLATCAPTSETTVGTAVPNRELRIAVQAVGGADRQKYWQLAPLAVLLMLLMLRRSGAGDQGKTGG